MPPKENLERDCEECIHYWACSRQCGEPMAQSSATGCECYETVKSIAAARLIERLTAENAALKKEIRKAGCMFCARFEDCPEGFKPTGQEDCDNCAKKPDCACMKCSGIGSSTDNWEWRGAPEAHNGKENS